MTDDKPTCPCIDLCVCRGDGVMCKCCPCPEIHPSCLNEWHDKPPERAEWDILIDGVVQWEENRTILRAAVQRALDEREQENTRLAAEVERYRLQHEMLREGADD